MLRPVIATIAACLIAAPVWAAPSAPAPPMPAPNPPLIAMLVRTMTGKPVIAVYTEERNVEDNRPEKAFRKGDSLLHRLEIVAEAGSAEEEPLIPFSVGHAWVLAPQTRQDVNANFSGLTPLLAASRSHLLDETLIRLTVPEIRRLGSSGGLNVASLPAETRAFLERALRPPLNVVEVTNVKQSGPDGNAQTSAARNVLQRIDKPVNWDNTRLQADLMTPFVWDGIDRSKGYVFMPGAYHKPHRVILETAPGEQGWLPFGVDLPVWVDVPNKFRPSDLNTRSLVAPAGLAGVHPVSEVVKRLAAVTGLKLSVAAHYSGFTVFIGSASLSCGDVADGLRLALTGTWRRLGGGYVLAWTREGLGADQQAVMEEENAGGSATQVVERRDEELFSTSGWLNLGRNLPFDPADPLALTDAQRQQVYADADQPGQNRRIHFPDMTAGQQDFVRQSASENMVVDHDSPRPMTAAELQGTYLDGFCHIQLRVDLPGVGWVDIAPNWAIGRVRVPKTKSEPANRPKLPSKLADPAPWVMPAPVRGLMVPVLGAARLGTLAEEMKRHGFTTLFYPILLGGYATFPSGTFALHPALRGEDGWSAAVAAMAPAGIKVVGYLNELSWQTIGDHAHWLNKHPNWLDVDILGRSRLAWAFQWPEAIPPAWATSLSNYVRPSVPDVGRRLEALVAEFARRAGSDGLAVADDAPPMLYKTEGSPDVTPDPWLPWLGYAPADRAERVKATGDDPVDEPAHWSLPLPRLLDRARRLPWAEDGASKGDPNSPKEDPHIALARRLLRRARTLRPNLKTYLVDEPNGVETDAWRKMKPADSGVDEFVDAPVPGAKGLKGILLSVYPQSAVGARAPGSPPDEEAPVKGIPSIVVTTWRSAARCGMPDKADAIIYDFRAAPEEITPSMQWITKAPAS